MNRRDETRDAHLRWERERDDEVRAQIRATLREIQDEMDHYDGLRFVDEPGAGRRPPPAGHVWPSLIRARFRALFDRAENRGLPHNARLALEVFCIETFRVNDRKVLDPE